MPFRFATWVGYDMDGRTDIGWATSMHYRLREKAMRLASLKEVPTAILSRQLAGTRGSSLIINLPGKPSAIRTCLDAVFAAVPYCIDLIGGPYLETDNAVCKAFRPKSAQRPARM